jgi:hypothetical protein
MDIGHAPTKISEPHFDSTISRSKSVALAVPEIVELCVNDNDENEAAPESVSRLHQKRAKFKKNALIWSSVRNRMVEPTKIVLLEIELVSPMCRYRSFRIHV